MNREGSYARIYSDEYDQMNGGGLDAGHVNI